jgi:hypothetical protein
VAGHCLYHLAAPEGSRLHLQPYADDASRMCATVTVMAGTHDFVALSHRALAPSFDTARASYQFFSPDQPCPLTEDGSGLVYSPPGREATVLISRLPGCDASVGVTFSNTTSTTGSLFFNALRGTLS